MKYLFIALVRPYLEYCAVAWRPQCKADLYKVEAVLRRATAIVPELRGYEYEERLQRMQIPSMWYRHQRADVIEVWKFLNDVYDTDAPALPQVRETCFDRPRAATRSSTSKKLEKRFAPNDKRVRLNFFSYRAVNLWNSLSPSTRCAESLNAFKNHKRLA